MPKSRVLNPANATPTDWNELRFWIWAAEQTAEVYLAIRSEWAGFDADRDIADPVEHAERFNRLMDRDRLARYQFMTAIGRLMQTLKIAQKLFPAIQGVYSRSRHLLTEGLSLRGLIEHEYEYFEDADAGQYPDQWVRLSHNGALSVDASSTVSTGSDVLLGGRFSVQMALAEIAEIKKVAVTIPDPLNEAPRP